MSDDDKSFWRHLTLDKTTGVVTDDATGERVPWVGPVPSAHPEDMRREYARFMSLLRGGRR